MKKRTSIVALVMVALMLMSACAPAAQPEAPAAQFVSTTRPVGQVVKTAASHAVNIGSNPVRVTKSLLTRQLKMVIISLFSGSYPGKHRSSS